MKTIRNRIIILALFSGIFACMLSCEKVAGPFIVEPCNCDTTPYKDEDCPCDPDSGSPPCLCDTTEYRDINCPCDEDTVPYPVCTCDTSSFLDPYCDCDNDSIPHPNFCWCDTTEWKDVNCSCDPDTIPLTSYGRDIQPLWEKYCTECHHEDAETIILTKEWSYSEIRNNSLVYLPQPEFSKIYTISYGPSKEMPPEEDGLTDAEAELLLWWIRQGALNN